MRVAFLALVTGFVVVTACVPTPDLACGVDTDCPKPLTCVVDVCAPPLAVRDDAGADVDAGALEDAGPDDAGADAGLDDAGPLEDAGPGEGEGEGEGEPCIDPDGDLLGVGCAADDNCDAVANAGQQDDDADGIGDACDACPLVANSGINVDNDLLDAACDPNDAVAGDSLAVFSSFDEALAPPFTVAAGTFSVVDGSLVQDNLGASALNIDVNSPRVRVHARVHIVAFGGAPIQNVLIGGRIDTDPDGYLCSARNSSPDTSAIFVMRNGVFASRSATTALPGAGVPIGATFDLILQVDDDVTCSVAGTVSTLPLQGDIDGDDVSIETDDGRVRIESIAVYRLP